MTAVLHGVRILEVAEHTFVPAASALLSDWGAEVIKIEHVERATPCGASRRPAWRSCRPTCTPCSSTPTAASGASASTSRSPDGLDILYQLAATADVFLTNKLPSVRAKLGIGVEEIRAAQPHIIYVRGTGQGERGPDADKGSYDSLAFWARAGVAVGAKRPEYDLVPVPPAPGFGDSIGGHDDRRRDHGCAVPPRAHRRGDDRRRVAPRRRALGHGPGDGAVAHARHAVGAAARPTDRRQPAGRGTT